jgi:hypothetical protein
VTKEQYETLWCIAKETDNLIATLYDAAEEYGSMTYADAIKGGSDPALMSRLNMLMIASDSVLTHLKVKKDEAS